MVLDYTRSVFLYALFMVAYFLPQVLMPLLAGPLLDRFSRRKAIYTLDFFSAAMYTAVFAVIATHSFNYPLLLGMAVLAGVVDSTYQVAYDSFFPCLISEGCMSRAYSIASVIPSLSAVMVPVAAWAYKLIGLAPIFAFNAATFLIAAVLETQIRADESHIRPGGEQNLARFQHDFREGVEYLRSERGLSTITLYFAVNALLSGGVGTLLLPYFKKAPGLGYFLYTCVTGCMVAGRLLGGVAHYLRKLPARYKFRIALGVYFTDTLVEGTLLYFPVPAMMALSLCDGSLCVTSYNIRIAATQNYIPDEKRARFNGVFLMSTTGGMLFGQLLAGLLGQFLPIRAVVTGLMACNLLAILLIMVRNRRFVQPIYNKDL